MTPSPVKLLSDAPACRDEFKSHEKVAEAITALITGSAKGGRAIAITGPWGSGKSTVVEIVKDRLANQSKSAGPRTLVFQFDAWAHQDDPPRRAFLESLRRFLLTSPYTMFDAERFGPHWQQEINRITGKSETSTTTTLKQITPASALIAILFLVSLPLVGPVTTRFGLKYAAMLIGFPLLIAAWTVVRGVWGRNAEPPASAPGGKRPSLSNEMLRVLLRDTLEEKVGETEKAGDATSVEFRNVFDTMVGALMRRRPHHLVIIVDNLDRVDAQKAVAIWSTMRIFFELDETRHDWSENLWLIAPFDPSSLKRLWTSDTTPGEADALVESFISKTFQVTFRVSPPVLAGWRDFFARNFKEAFLEESTRREWRTIYRLYDRFNPQPSFRNIKLFLNKLIVLYLQWGTSIPLPFLALYILIASKMGDSILEVVIGRSAPSPPARKVRKLAGRQGGANTGEAEQTEFVSPAVLELLPPVKDAKGATDPHGWKKLIAAVHFNVEPDQVVHVLIGDELKQAIESGNAEAVKRLADVPDFWVAAERVIDDRLPALLGKRELLSTISLLHAIEVDPRDDESAAQRIVALLGSRAARLTEWDFGLVSLVRGIIPKDDYELFKANVLAAASHIPEDVNQTWVDGVIDATRALSVSGLGLTADTAIGAVRATRLFAKSSLLDRWQISLKETEYASVPSALLALINEIKSGELKPLLSLMSTWAPAGSWERFRELCINTLKAAERSPTVLSGEGARSSPKIPLLIEGALTLPTSSLREQRATLAAFSQNPLTQTRINRALDNSLNEQDWSGAAFCFIALFTSTTKAAVSQWIENREGSELHAAWAVLQGMMNGGTPELYAAFLTALRLLEMEEMLLVPGLEQSDSAVVARRAITDLSTTPGQRKLSAAAFIARYRKISARLSEANQAEIVSALVQSSDLLDLLSKPRKLRTRRSRLYLTVLKNPSGERLVAPIIKSLLEAPVPYVVTKVHTEPDFQALFVALLDAAGPAWLSPELLSHLTGLDATDDGASPQPASPTPKVTDVPHDLSAPPDQEATP